MKAAVAVLLTLLALAPVPSSMASSQPLSSERVTSNVTMDLRDAASQTTYAIVFSQSNTLIRFNSTFFERWALGTTFLLLSGNYISTVDAQVNFSSGDFALEAWVSWDVANPTVDKVDHPVLAQNQYGPNGGSFPMTYLVERMNITSALGARYSVNVGTYLYNLDVPLDGTNHTFNEALVVDLPFTLAQAPDPYQQQAQSLQNQLASLQSQEADLSSQLSSALRNATTLADALKSLQGSLQANETVTASLLSESRQNASALARQNSELADRLAESSAFTGRLILVSYAAAALLVVLPVVAYLLGRRKGR